MAEKSVPRYTTEAGRGSRWSKTCDASPRIEIRDASSVDMIENHRCVYPNLENFPENLKTEK
eukprot:SAG31_NODE_4353_length_3321_cov_2.678150_2_plen_62_part_00